MLWRPARWLGASLAVLLGLFALLLVALRQPGEDPLAALPRGAGPAAEISHLASHDDGRLIRQYTIRDPELGPVGLVVSLPVPLPDRPLPIVVVLGGLVGWIVLDGQALRRRLADLEARGIRRRSAGGSESI